jgi:ComF family protein
MRIALLSDWLPRPCLFCGTTGDRGGICRACRADLPGWQAPRCPVCAIGTPAAAVCGQCLQAPRAFDRTVTVASYAFPLDAAIVRLKYGRDLTLVSALAQLLWEAACSHPRPDLVVPMPLSPARLRERGFNQAAELGRVVAAQAKVRFRADAALRTRDGVPQASLPLAERAGNVRGAFASSLRLQGQRVAIVDDVMTTGASLESLARELRHAGAGQVVCWVLARTERTA